MFELRPYQDKGIADIREAFRSGKRAPLYTAPTGSGKTLAFCHMAQGAHRKGNRVMILVHRGELLRQTSKALQDQDIPHSFIASGREFLRDNLIHVGTVQTVARRLDRVEPPDLLILDECHHYVSPTFKSVVEAFPKAKMIGLSASPARLDGRGLGEIFDHLIHGPEVSDLIEQGYLARPIYYAPPVGIDLSGVRTVAGDFNKGQLEERVDRPSVTGNAVEHYRRLAGGVPAIAFCVSIKHMNAVVEQFNAAGVRALGIDGSMDDETRAKRIDGLRTGTLDVLASVDLLGEGVDVPAVGCGIMLRPTESLTVHLQQIGRILRPAPAKERALILDHAGNCLRLGLAEETREWSLDPKVKIRRSAQSEEPEFRIRACPNCYGISRWVTHCPQCGYEFPIESRMPRTGKGTLEEINARELERLRKSAEVRMASQTDDKEGARAALQKIAKERGYDPRWVGMQMMLRMKRRFRKKQPAEVEQTRLFAETT